LITPQPLAGPQYYKIGTNFTFVWNYTSLSKPPAAIGIYAAVTTDLTTKTFTFAQNMSFDATQTVVFNTKNTEDAVGQVLLTADYTLIVFDAQQGPSAQPSAGQLGSWKQFTFGMYTPQPYTPLSDFQCPTCLKSLGIDRTKVHAMGFVLACAAITIASFTWFSATFGAL
jgi:hypothetical protein